jgi:proteasome lid subunit RPN8/RPN11
MEQRLITDASLLHRHMKDARRVASRHREICGLLVSTDNYRLRLLPVRNTSKRLGSFEITPSWWRIARRSGGFHDRDVVGTYHSHPASPPEPGESDIAGTWEGALMLILNCNHWHYEARLWRVRGGAAHPVPLAAVA